MYGVADESIHVAIHEPYTTTTRILSVRALDVSGDDGAIGLQVDLGDRVDTFLSSLDNSGHVNASAYELRGRAGFVRQDEQSVTDMVLADGKALRAGEEWLLDESIYAGEVLDIWRLTDGDPANAFITTALPPAGDLVGRTLTTEDAEHSTKAFAVAEVESLPGGSVALHVDGEPGMALREGHVKLLFFPNWAMPGGLTFHVANRAFGP